MRNKFGNEKFEVRKITHPISHILTHLSYLITPLLLIFLILILQVNADAWRMTPELRKEIKQKEEAARKNPDDPWAKYDHAVTYSYTNKILEAWDQ